MTHLMKKRYTIQRSDIELVTGDLLMKMNERLKEKGDHTMASSHEIWGIIAEELDEFKEEVRANSPDGQYRELIDLGVAVLFGLATMIRWTEESAKRRKPCPCHELGTCALHKYHHADESCECNCKESVAL